jgi:outer membrane receptor for ferrienterochelin and colicin
LNSSKRITGTFFGMAIAGAAAAAPDVTPPAPQKVIIAGQARPVRTEMDRKVYTVSSELQGITGSAADVLNTIPSVSVDADGNISLRGNSSVLILVDGRPSAQLSGSRAGDGLTQFSANDIERIEVMTTAPAQYKAEGTGGVINIVTRKARNPGAAGNLLANIGNRRRFVLGASGSYNTEQLKLSATLGVRQDKRERHTESQLSTPGANAGAASEDRRDDVTRRRVESLKGGLEFQATPDDVLSVDIKLRERNGDRYSDQTSTGPGTAALRHSDGYEWSYSGEQRLSYKHQLAGKDETIDLSLHRSTDVERERYAYHNIMLRPAPGSSADHLYLDHDFHTIEFAVDYKRSLSSGQLVRIGYGVQQDKNGFGNLGDNVDALSGLPIINPDLSNQFRYRQTIQAAYASLEQTLGLWTVATGLRAEHTVSQGDQLTTGRTDRRRYGGLYPSLHLERSLDNDAALSFGASRRLTRPDQEDLNPLIDHQDIHNLRTGNPNLLPQETAILEAGYRREWDKHNVGVTAYLRRNRNATTDVIQQLAADVLLSSKTNLPSSRASGIEFNTDGPWTETLSYRFNGNLFHNDFDGSALGVGGKRATSGLNLKGSLDYRPSRNDTAQLSLIRTDKRLTPQGTIRPIHLVNLGYKHQFSSDLALVATLSDAFNGQRFERQLETPTLRQTYRREQAGRIAYIGLVVQFGVQKKTKGDGFEFEQ